MGDQLFTWLLSVFGALLSFVAIFVALETFFIQDWLSKVNSARVAFFDINGLSRPLTVENQRTISSGQHKIEEALNSFPEYMMPLLTIVSLTAILVAIVFYWDTSASVGTVAVFWIGLIVPALLALIVIAFASYSYFQRHRLGKWVRLVKRFAETPSIRTLKEAPSDGNVCKEK